MARCAGALLSCGLSVVFLVMRLGGGTRREGPLTISMLGPVDVGLGHVVQVVLAGFSPNEATQEKFLCCCCNAEKSPSNESQLAVQELAINRKLGLH